MNKNEKYKLKVKRERSPGEIVVARRTSFGWSQEELSWRSGISVSQISRIERDIVKPGFETVKKLEKALDMELFDLFMAYRPQVGMEDNQPKSMSDSLRQFESELAKRKLKEEELQEILQKALSELNSNGETDEN